jgi:hypothetical protein
MGKISTYPNVVSPSLSDKLIGTDTTNNDETVNFLLSDIFTLVTDYGSFYEPSDQTATVINTGNEVKFSNSRTLSGSGISVVNNLSGNPTRITVTKTGIYKINFQLQVNSSGGSHAVSAWFRTSANGDVAFSYSKITLGNNTEHLLTGDIILPLQANDYFNIIWSTNNTSAFLNGEAPAIPSSLLNIILVGN